MGLSHNIADWSMEIKTDKFNLPAFIRWGSELKSWSLFNKLKMLFCFQKRNQIMMTSSKRLDFQYYIRFFNHFCITEIAFNKLINPFRKLGVASDYSLPKSYFPKGKMQSESNVYFAPLSLSDHLLSGIYPLKIKSSIKTSSRQIQGLELIIQTEFSYFRTPFINKTRTFEILQTFQHFWNTLCNKLQLFKPITFTTYNRIWPNNFGQVNSKYR